MESKRNNYFQWVCHLVKPEWFFRLESKFTRKRFLLFSAILGLSFSIGLVNNSAVFATTNYTATITAPDISLNVSPMGDGANVTTNNITVDSTCPYGYTVSISGPSDTTLYKDGDNTSSYTINTSSGTKLAPTSIIGANVGTWGYSTLAGTTASSSNFIGLTNEVSELFSKETS